MKEEILKEFEEFGELYSFPFGLTNSVMGYKFEKDGSNSPISGKCDTEEIKSFLSNVISQTEKAFGGCLNCYGKGYHTTIEYASGHGEWDMGQGDIKIHYQLPEMRFCNCDRGIELKKRFDATQKEAYEKGRLETIKEIEEKLPDKIITVFTIPMQTWRKGGFNDCLKEV